LKNRLDVIIQYELTPKPQLQMVKQSVKQKKRFKVALLTEKPPQIQVTKGSPKTGTADKILVITVAPQ
jgi:hypothetical protein